jgi:hypothetical protein
MLLPLRGLDHPLSACEIRLQLTKAGVPSKEDQSIRAAWRESKERRALAQAVSCTEKRQAGRPGHVMASSGTPDRLWSSVPRHIRHHARQARGRLLVRRPFNLTPALTDRQTDLTTITSLPSSFVPLISTAPHRTAPYRIVMSGWEVRFSNSRQLPYFYNAGNGQSVWEPPAELSPEQIRALPGATQYLSGSGNAAAKGGKEGQVRASHILAKHQGSRRPSSWREVSGHLDFGLGLWTWTLSVLVCWASLGLPIYPSSTSAGGRDSAVVRAVEGRVVPAHYLSLAMS